MNKILKEIKALSGAIEFNYLPKQKRQITFYSEGKNYWPHLEGLLKTTLNKTDKFICYVSSDLGDPGIKIKHPKLKTFFIGKFLVRNYFFQNMETDVMVTTMPDLHQYQLKRSHHNVHYIYVQHSLVSLHSVYRHGAFDYYDTICAAGPHHVKEIEAIEKKYSLAKKKIIKLGYSRLDNLIKINKKILKYEKKQKQSYKQILIAPSWGPNAIIESGFCKNLTEKLLNLGYAVILRPHPQTVKFAKNELREIHDRYKNNPLFSIEESLEGNESLLKSDIMISDWSGAAIEFALAFDKPVIFCKVPQKINNINYKDIQIEPIEVSIRNKIGLIWDGLSPIDNMIKLSIKKNNNNLSTLKENYCFNLGFSDDVFVEILKKKFS
tara:strand:+ start:508 stop:1647 length:1140 start_codon:yes stop_codon:yes gene_type:complete